LVGGIGQHRIVHARQPRVALEPCLVAEEAVGAGANDDRFLGLEVGLQFPERDEFGRADECEIPWIEEQHEPLTAMLGYRHTPGPMGASYPIVHYGFRCRGPDLDAHQMPPGRLPQSLEEVCKLESMCESTEHVADLSRQYHASFQRQVSNFGFSQSRWTAVQYRTGGMSAGSLADISALISLADISALISDVRFAPESGHAQ